MTTSAMTLGNFSVSLAVKDIEASRAFYQTLGFAVIAGDGAQRWLILRNGEKERPGSSSEAHWTMDKAFISG